ncbi:MAG: hypothetical protein IT210_20460 [Armatimonadetes bacterium]|nr:hypothetical protein [Armatimonadota bacterium]
MGVDKLILFGAGMTGRGQVAQLAYEDGWQITLVDKNRELVDTLREAGRYTIRLLGSRSRDIAIHGFHTLHTDEIEAVNRAVSGADMVVTSVLEPNLPEAAQVIAGGLVARFQAGNDTPLTVIAAENMSHSSTVLKQYVRSHLPADCLEALEANVGFPDSMIARVVPVAEDPLLIMAEEYSEWTADANAVRGEPPHLTGLEWVSDQTARLQRKLYIHNTGHAVCGYLGWLKGYRYIHEAAQDEEIMARISEAISESGEAIARKHGFGREEVRAYEDNLKERLIIAELPDEIRRVIRQPIRKLGPEERLLGPLALCEKYGLPCSGLCYAIAAVLACRMPGDAQFDRIRATVDWLEPVAALQVLDGHRPGPRASENIARAYQEIIAQYA